MSPYDNDPRVTVANGQYLVTATDRRWLVSETGQQWDAWPYPECDDPGFDDQGYMQAHLRGRGADSPEEKIRELIGDPL